MMWIIASLPFWIIGLALLALGLAALAALLKSWGESTADKAAQGLWSVVIVLVLSGGALWIAARMAS